MIIKFVVDDYELEEVSGVVGKEIFFYKLEWHFTGNLLKVISKKRKKS